MAFERKKSKQLIKTEDKDIDAYTFLSPEKIKNEKSAQGKMEFISFLKGEHLNLMKSIKAYCFTCMGFYADGIDDCKNIKCPLHPYMPYNPKKSVLRVRKKD